MTMQNHNQFEDATFLEGRLAEETTDANDVWLQIGSNWAVSRTLTALSEKETGHELASFDR